MEKRHREILRRHWSELRKDLEPIKLLPHMVDVLDETDEQEVKVKATREERSDKLLGLLPRRGPEAFQVFVKALQEVQPFLASPLVQESEMEEMKVELNQARTRSARLREEIQFIKTDFDSKRKSHEKTAKELEEIKSLHKAMLEQSKTERQNVLLRIQELENANKKVGEELVDEKNEKELYSEEMNRLREMCDEMYEEAQQKDSELQNLKENFRNISEEKTKLVEVLMERTDYNLNEMDGTYPSNESDVIPITMETREKEPMNSNKIPTFISQLMKYSDTEKWVRTQSSGTDRADSVLEKSRKQCELVRVSNERDALKMKCEELEQQLEDTLASLERQRTVSFHDRATSPGEPLHHDFEDQGCLRCEALEEECDVLRTEKDFIKGRKEKFEEEIKQLRNKVKELEEDYHREKQKLQDEIQSTKEQFERLSQNYTKELNSVACALAEEQSQEMKTLQEEKDGLKHQLDKFKSETQKLTMDLVKERAKAEKNQQEFDKGKKTLSREKKKVKELKEELTNEASVKKDLMKELKKLKNDLEDSEQQRHEETVRFGEGLKSEREKCEALKEEIEKWRSLPGRVFNHRKDFDRHGVIYALGTNFGTTAWVNPSNASSSLTRVIVTRSSDDRGEATDLLENRKATLTGTKDEDRSWWCVDLSEKYALFLSHYTLRHGRDNGMSIIRNWRLEGSLDGRIWRLLKKHENDRGLKDPFPYYTATWSIDGEVGAFRYFRIIQTGKNSSGRFAVFLSGIELYGILLEMGH